MSWALVLNVCAWAIVAVTFVVFLPLFLAAFLVRMAVSWVVEGWEIADDVFGAL
jgi:hypothetical protein